jgi:hypothetical protein
MGRVDSTRVSQLKLRGKATEPAQSPLIQITIDVCYRAKCGSLFQSGCQGIRAVVVDHVTGAFSRSAMHQQTCNHTSKQAAHKKSFHEALQQCILCVHWWHAGVLKSASVPAMGRLAFWPGRAHGVALFRCGLYPGGMLDLSGIYLPISLVHKQGDYAACIRIGSEQKKIRQKGGNFILDLLIWG